jgi:hypothetical protein
MGGEPLLKTIKEFLNAFRTWPEVIQNQALRLFDIETELARSKSVEVAPERSGELRARKNQVVLKAKVTPTGIRSAYIFAKPYAMIVESGVREGKPLEIRTTINPLAQAHYGAAGVKSREEPLMDAIKALVSKSFGAL